MAPPSSGRSQISARSHSTSMSASMYRARPWKPAAAGTAQRKAENGVDHFSVRQPRPRAGSQYQGLAGSRDRRIQVISTGREACLRAL